MNSAPPTTKNVSLHPAHVRVPPHKIRKCFLCEQCNFIHKNIKI